MSLLVWDEPRKAKSKAKWAETSFEDGPKGGFIPNMSDSDNERWKAKLTGTKLGFPQVEIRKAAGSLMTIIVNLGDGYNYKGYRSVPDPDRTCVGKTPTSNTRSYLRTQEDIDYSALRERSTRGVQIHISMNGPSTMSLREMGEMHLAIAEAVGVLEELIGKGEREPYAVTVSRAVETQIDGIEGAKVHFSLPSTNCIIVTATETAVREIEALPDVISVESEEMFAERCKSAHDRRHYGNR